MGSDSESHETKKADQKKSPKIVRWAVLLGITIVLTIFVFVVRSLVFQMPNQETYCPSPTPVSTSTPQTSQSCTAAGGIWNPETAAPAPQEVQQGSVTGPAIILSNQGYCDLTIKCMDAYNSAENQYALDSFVLEIGLGLLAIVIGILPIGSSIVSAGFAYGGVLTFIVAAAQYWGNADNLLRLGMLIIALAILIYIGIKRFHD